MRKVAYLPIYLYKKFLSGAIKALFGSGCRFIPTCGDYAKDAIEKHGIILGLSLSARRLIRCNPLGGAGYDPVPGKI